MTTTSIDATGSPSPNWVLRRDGDSDVLVRADEPEGGAEQPGLGFLDFLDVINPLQHLPVIGTIYRAMTGDTIGDAARVAGGALYGGPFGLIGGFANVVFEAETGGDVGESVLAWLGDEPAAAGTDAAMLAAREQERPATAAAPINEAPINETPVTAAALVSPEALAETVQAAAPAAANAAAAATTAAAPATTAFAGRSADRLDSFIRQANAVRRGNPLAVDRGAAAAAPTGFNRARLDHSGIDPARLQAAVLQPPGVSTEADRPPEDAGSVNQWMLRALDKYEHMRKQETS